MGVSVRAGKRHSTTRMKYVYSNRPSKVIHVQEVSRGVLRPDWDEGDQERLVYE